MATPFNYGPYANTAGAGLAPGQEQSWSFGPWPWYADAVIVTAHPLSRRGADQTMKVTSVSSHSNPAGERFIFCTVRNVGQDSTYYAIWLGGVKP